MTLEYIRICLGTDGSARYIPKYVEEEDLHIKNLDPLDAIIAITAKGIPIEVACYDPESDPVHYYESFFSDGKSNSSLFTLKGE